MENIRKVERKREKVYEIYVVDKLRRVMLGVVRMRRIIIRKKDEKIM